MTFDWFTLVAQLVNFGILLLLLRLFLYGPIQRVIAQREERLMAVQADAAAAKEQARLDAEAVRREREALGAEAREHRADLARALAREREQRMSEVEDELNEARANAARRLERDGADLVIALTRRTSEIVVAELRRALSQIADATLEAAAVDVMKRLLGDLDEATRASLRDASVGQQVVITTAFPTTESLKAELSAIAVQASGASIAPTFEVDPALIFGVAMRFGSYRVAWGAEGFVAELERALAERITEVAATTTAAAAPAPPAAGTSPS